MISDNGKCFTAQLFKEFLTLHGCNLKLIPRQSPFYGGFYERSHLSIVQSMILLLQEQPQSNWKHALRVAVSYVNRKPFDFSNGYTLCPWEVFKGRRLPSVVEVHAPLADPRPSLQQMEENLPVIAEDTVEIHERFEEIWKQLRQRSFTSIQRRWNPIDNLKLGEKVMRWVHQRARSDKLQPAWEGPYEVQEVLGENRAVVVGREEHVYNLRRFTEPGDIFCEKDVDGEVMIDEICASDEDENPGREPEPTRPKRKAKDEANLNLKKLRVATVEVARGMLLWM